MKEPYEEGVAIHSAPSFAPDAVKCPAKRKHGAQMGWVLSFENLRSGRRHRHHCGRQHGQQRYRERLIGPA